MGLILENIHYYDFPVFLLTGFEENWEEPLINCVFQDLCALLEFSKHKTESQSSNQVPQPHLIKIVTS